ncbi:MAG: hypothetical protein KKH54_14690, partial [Alphaproteobacteria bacterium]|nr:hypothetical protein [Alphaproteobacteria bacterium]
RLFRFPSSCSLAGPVKGGPGAASPNMYARDTISQGELASEFYDPAYRPARRWLDNAVDPLDDNDRY